MGHWTWVGHQQRKSCPLCCKGSLYAPMHRS